MSNEHAPTDGEGESTDGGSSVVGERTMSAADLDALFEILADEKRRRILTHLDETDEGVAAFSELIEHVADDEATDEARQRLAVGLHHTHLPKLADADLVEYDTRSETVRYRGGPVVTDWIELAESQRSDASNF